MRLSIKDIQNKPLALLIGATVLYLLSFLFGSGFSQRSTFNLEKNNLDSYIQKQQEHFNKLVGDTDLIKKLARRNESKEELDNLINDHIGFFLFKKNQFGDSELLFWNNQYTYPSHQLFKAIDGEYFEKLDNGYYLVQKNTLPINGTPDSIMVFGAILVKNDYFAKDDYLPAEFAHSRKAHQRMSISFLPTTYPVKYLSGKIAFYVAPLTITTIGSASKLSNFLRILAAIILLIAIHFWFLEVKKKQGFFGAFTYLSITLIFLRVISYFTSFPVNLRQFDLFDPSVYGANPINKSLGDLLINSLLFFWLVLLIWRQCMKDDNFIFRVIGSKKSHGVTVIILTVAITLLTANMIRGLAAHSSISFDVINFFTLSEFTLFGFITLSILATGYYYFMRVVLSLVQHIFRDNFYFVYFIIGITGLSYLTFQINNKLLGFYLIVLIWLIIFIRLLRFRLFVIHAQRMNLSAALFWIFIFSISITSVIIDANREKEWQVRERYAYNINAQTDPYNETQLSISFTYIDDDFLQNNFYRFKQLNSARFLRDSLLKESGFLHKYDTRIYVFDENRQALFNEEGESANTLDAILRVQAKETSVPHLYYYETSYGNYTFIFKREARDENGRLLGILYVLSDPDPYTSEALYAELFQKSNQEKSSQEKNYSYGVYKNRVLLIGPFNKYTFPTTISQSEMPLNRIEKRFNGDFSELWYRASNDKVVVIARKQDSVLEAITLFSYIFCVFLFLVALFNVLTILLKVGWDTSKLQQLLQWNIRTQVHGTIIFISILSFVVIGVATISFFIKRYEQNNEERLSKTMEIMVREMEKKLDRRRAMDDMLAIYDSVSNGEVQRLVDEVAEIHNVDVNVYDTTGNLHVTSQPIIYREGYLSRMVHPQAFYHLNRLHQVQYVQQEKLADINYMSIYAPLRDPDNGLAYAYINIPYFLSQSELKQEISNFLVTIINLNAFIFLIAGVVALFITNRVTRSLSLISEKMQAVNLGKANEEIEWKRDDEIGGLVREYNKMVKKLEVSAEALARSEREGAWREMARQVAHEIKNPLTPMKLSIQYLQRSIDTNSGDVKTLTANVAKTLVEQIDHLSKIAFDFSQFANIGNTKPERFDLNEVLNSLGDLYTVNENVEIRQERFPGEIILFTDKTQMNRLFTNLFQNAVEACSGKGKCVITLKTITMSDMIRVSVSDNGEGIPDDMQSKIFVPNFTTKSSGTGLGLAICKGIVEKAKGNIWFETKKGEGTTFFVELPLAG